MAYHILDGIKVLIVLNEVNANKSLNIEFKKGTITHYLAPCSVATYSR